MIGNLVLLWTIATPLTTNFCALLSSWMAPNLEFVSKEESTESTVSMEFSTGSLWSYPAAT